MGVYIYIDIFSVCCAGSFLQFILSLLVTVERISQCHLSEVPGGVTVDQ